MLKKCANPECSALFRKFGTGKLFRVERRHTSPLRSYIEFYWLCAECADSMRLVIGPDTVPTVVRGAVEKAAAAAA